MQCPAAPPKNHRRVALARRVSRRHSRFNACNAPTRLFDAAALRVVDAVGYEGAGTVEFVADAHGDFLSLGSTRAFRSNTASPRCARGSTSWKRRFASPRATAPGEVTAPTLSGHAIEARVYAEDPAEKFAPQPGTLARVAWPAESTELALKRGFTKVSP